MKTLLLALTLLAFTGMTAQSQSIEKKDSTATKEVSGKVLFGLYSWGKNADKSPNFDFRFKTSKLESSFGGLSENDSTVVKSTLWGAIQWTERKKPTATPDAAKTESNNQ